MSAIQLKLIQEPTIEAKLSRMKELKDSMAILEAEFNMLKTQAIAEYFEENDTYMTSKGMVLATYKFQIRTQFKSAEFKKVQPELYEEFLDIREVRSFLIK